MYHKCYNLSMANLSIYVHVPFCERKCPYCDFHSDIVNCPLSLVNFVKDICGEIRKSKITNYNITSIYFGGGTPSLLSGEQVAQIVGTIRKKFSVSSDAEITIECNPNSLNECKLKAYRTCGINRISIGVQSFSNRALKILGRTHNVRQATVAIERAAKYFDNVSIDLMHSIPGARVKIPHKYLRMVQHVSAYCLTSEKFQSPSEEKSIREQSRIERILAKHGIKKYEVSNFARAGYECRHNMNYWTCGEWIGFGDGAQSHLNESWDTQDRVMLGLRLVQGVPCELLANKMPQIKELVAEGLLQNDTKTISCTERGFLLLNYVLLKIFMS